MKRLPSVDLTNRSQICPRQLMSVALHYNRCVFSTVSTYDKLNKLRDVIIILFPLYSQQVKALFNVTFHFTLQHCLPRFLHGLYSLPICSTLIKVSWAMCSSLHTQLVHSTCGGLNCVLIGVHMHTSAELNICGHCIVIFYFLNVVRAMRRDVRPRPIRSCHRSHRGFYRII